ncbi:MAG: CHAT domain-containing protein, partial [Cyanobacteria bacterium P01_H01_bin.105]
LQPQIVHFSGHGTSDGALCFENQLGQAHPVAPDALTALFEQFADQVECVLLNACYSEAQAVAIAKHINYVIGMNQAIGDEAAIAFAIGFYQAIGAGRNIEEAHKLGCVQIRFHGTPEHLIPVLVKGGQR